MLNIISCRSSLEWISSAHALEVSSSAEHAVPPFNIVSVSRSKRCENVLINKQEGSRWNSKTTLRAGRLAVRQADRVAVMYRQDDRLAVR